MGKGSSEFMVRYTNKDIMEKIESLHDIQEQTLMQTKKTNGRVTVLENKSIGVWVNNNKVKTLMLMSILFSILISDSREAIVGLLIKAFTGL